MQKFLSVFGLVIMLFSASQVKAKEAFNMPAEPASSASGNFLAIRGETRPPMGWVQFCRDLPQECGEKGTAPRDAVLSKASWAQLDAINRQVNRDIIPITDWDHYGVEDYWTYPDDGMGDCEKYVLEKRRRLRHLGWPESALLITVVRDSKNEGHAVLMVRTTDGDLILDNLNTEIRHWSKTPYRYVKRQSQWSVNTWVSLAPDTGRAEIATSTRR